MYYYFARWQTTGTLQRLNEAANRADRLACHRPPTPSLALVDAQSVKLAPRLGQQRGLDIILTYRRQQAETAAVVADIEALACRGACAKCGRRAHL